MVAALAGRELGAAGQPQAGAAADARAPAAAAPPAAGPPPAAGVLPRRAPRSALAHGHDQSVWVAEHGWCYLNAAIDCCTREITGWSLDVRCRAAGGHRGHRRAPSPARQIRPGELTLGTDNGTALTARAFRARLAEHGIVHRRGGYRDPESQAFIESWFSKLKERCVWREEFETLDAGPRRRSAPTSTATTTGPTPGWPTARRARSRPPGRITTTS